MAVLFKVPEMRENFEASGGENLNLNATDSLLPISFKFLEVNFLTTSWRSAAAVLESWRLWM